MKIVWRDVAIETAGWLFVMLAGVGVWFFVSMHKVGQPPSLEPDDHHHILRHLHELRNADRAQCYYIEVAE